MNKAEEFNNHLETLIIKRLEKNHQILNQIAQQSSGVILFGRHQKHQN